MTTKLRRGSMSRRQEEVRPDIQIIVLYPGAALVLPLTPRGLEWLLDLHDPEWADILAAIILKTYRKLKKLMAEDGLHVVVDGHGRRQAVRAGTRRKNTSTPLGRRQSKASAKARAG